MAMKYWLISFGLPAPSGTGLCFFNGVLAGVDPLTWLLAKRPRNYVLLHWEEISAELFELAEATEPSLSLIEAGGGKAL